MKRVIKSSLQTRGKSIKASVDWSYFKKFEHVDDQYLPSLGEGTTMATQICTAVNKLVYKWYNDGDVFDNTYGLEGWANDLSSYANWLRRYVPESVDILDRIFDIYNEDEYELLLKDLCDNLLDAEDIENYDKLGKVGSVYNCSGPYKFEEYSEDEEDYYEEDDYEEDEEKDDWY